MTTNMNFGPEWMRGDLPTRSSPLDSQHSYSMSNIAETGNYAHIKSNDGQHNTMDDARHGYDDSKPISSASAQADGMSDRFKYSKEFMLSLFRPGMTPVDFQRHEYATVEEEQKPLAFFELSEDEKKLLAGPVHSEVTRRIVASSNGERPPQRSNHREMYGSPMFSPASENTPGAPNRMNMQRAKGRSGDYFTRERDFLSKRPDHEGGRQREWSQSDNLRVRTPGRFRGDDKDETLFGGIDRETMGSLDGSGGLRPGGNHVNGNNTPDDILHQRERQGGSETLDAVEPQSYPARHHADGMFKDAFGAPGSLGSGKPLSGLDHGVPVLGNGGFNQPSHGRFGLDGYDANGSFGNERQLPTGVLGGLAPGVPPEQPKWYYRDPQGIVQGPFEAEEMHEWYKAGFFVPTLLVRREDEAQFEPLIGLIRRVGNEDEPFFTHLKTQARIPPSTNTMDLFSRDIPSTSTLLSGNPTSMSSGMSTQFGNGSQSSNILSPQTGGLDFGSKLHSFGSLTPNFLHQPMGYMNGSLHSPSVLPDNPLGGFGPSILGGRDGLSPWGDKPRTPTWLSNNQNDFFGGLDNSNMASLLQRQQLQLQQMQQQQHTTNPLFGGSGVSSPALFDYQRTLSEQTSQQEQYLQMLQQKQQQHIQQQQQLQLQQQQQQQQPLAEPLTHQPTDTDAPARPSVSQINEPGISESTQDNGEPFAEAHKVEKQILSPSGWGSPTVDHKTTEQAVSPQKQNLQAPSVGKEEDSMIQSMSQMQLNTDAAGSPRTSSPPVPAGNNPVPLVKPMSLRDIQAEEIKKQKEAAKQQELAQQVAKQKKTSKSDESENQARDSHGSDHMGGKTSWGSAPWGRDATVPKGPSLREIQEMEAKEAEARKQAKEALLQQNLATATKSITTVSSWGATASIKPSSSTTAAWGSTSAPKKTLREIQMEEEAAAKKKAAKAQQQAAAAAAAALTASKAYANVAGTPVSRSPSQNDEGWTTVTNQRSASKAAPSVVAPTVSNNTSARTQQSGWETVGTPKPTSTPSAARPSTVVASSARKPDQGQKPASEEFLRWCRQSLRGLNAGVNGDEILHMLISFPLDSSSAEIIQDIIYANSTAMDGRRFAEEFMKRRKADLAGKLHTIASSIPSTTTYDDDGFEVVTKKGKKKNIA